MWFYFNVCLQPQDNKFDWLINWFFQKSSWLYIYVLKSSQKPLKNTFSLNTNVEGKVTVVVILDGVEHVSLIGVRLLIIGDPLESSC